MFRLGSGNHHEAKSDQALLSMLTIYDGRECIGHLYLRGKLGVEAYDSDDRSLGVYPNQNAAANAVSLAAGRRA
jgi:hypothetical protein